MIDYSLGLRLLTPGDPESKREVCAYAQARQVLNITALAKHIQTHGSPYTRDIIVGVLTKTVDCIRELLLDGNKVQLGEMGAFYVTLTSDGVEDATKFNPSDHITAVKVHWERSKAFADLLPEATFNLVTTRKVQTEDKKAAKEALNEAMGVSGNSSESGSTSGSDNTGGDSGDGVTE